jgi:tetratricopeptide (TPR) repeat protein
LNALQPAPIIIMETYPGELLVGVCPLVFCVDATIDKANEDQGDNNSHTTSHASRSQFDRFLDSMAASLLDEMEDPLQMADESMKRKSEDVMMALFRGDEAGDSDNEDDMVLGNNSSNNPIIGSPNASYDAAAYTDDSRPSRVNNRSRSFSNMGFGRLGTRSKATAMSHGINISFAKALQQGQEFFQRARIVSIGPRHGFPPSKDADGEKNRINEFYQGKTFQTSKLIAATKKRPIDGILPSGWLEKHANALPSVLLVVVQVTTHQLQGQQNKLLAETLENLQHSVASKRECSIRILGLVSDVVSTSLAEQWEQELVDAGNQVTLLKEADLQQDAPPSRALKNLHRSVRNASLEYYLKQARRTKQKLFKLGPARTSPLLLPLTIRYCFKVAMLYEFQWKHEKSLKFMVEAYRHVVAFYRLLLQQRGGEDNSADTSEDDPVKISLSNHPPTASSMDGGEGVEMALNNSTGTNNEEELELMTPAGQPEDMVHQCRAVANWLNFKILQSGLVSHTEGGLLAASSQWQKHCQVYCNPRRSFVCSPDNAWLDWSFVAHQRVVISQLLERHPPRALGDLGSDFDEMLLRCSPWRTYEAAAEAILKVGAEIRKVANKTDAGGHLDMDGMRTRYVGCLDHDGHTPKLEEERNINHRGTYMNMSNACFWTVAYGESNLFGTEKALDCILRSLSLLERDVEKAQKENADFVPWDRSSARLLYLAGGTLLGLERHAEAIPYLEKAAGLAKGWSGLELVIRRILIECYEKHIPSESDENSQTLASMLLDSYFNAEMSNKDLRLALEKFSSFSGGGTIKWYRDCFDEADAALPFSFALTFPSTTHAIAGDSVQASVLIKSNLDYAVHVNSVTLMSLAGEITVPSSDLLSARNANEGTGGGIIIQAKTEIMLSTNIKLPKDLDQIAVDEAGNGGEKQGVAGKGSFAKSARPRTGGITSAGT